MSKENATLGDFFRVLRQRAALIALILAVVFITTVSVTAFLPKWYLATTKIRVEKPEGEMKLFQAQTSGYIDPIFLADQAKILQSEKILYPVIENLGLNAKLAASLGSGSPLTNGLSFEYLQRKMLRVDLARSSSLIEINVFAQDARLGAAIANEIARVYSEDRIDFATSEQREGLGQLRKELTLQEALVSRQRDAVEKLRKDLNISGVDLNARYNDIEIETLRQMQNSLIALSVDAIGRKTRWERFKSIPMQDRMALINSELIQDTNIQNLLQAYLVADQTVTKLKARLGEAHPDLISAVDSRAKIREQLDTQLRGYENSLEIAYKEADSRVAELKSQLGQAKVDQILSARERMRPFEEAAQKLDDETRLMTTLKLTLRQREIDFQVPKRTIEILNTAEPGLRASKPNWPINVLFAIFVGGMLGVGVALSLEYFDTSFRSVADVETRLKLPVLGVIPYSKESRSEPGDNPAEAEPFRVLHTNLNLTLKPGRAACFVIFSAGPGEGKSTTLHHLARLMAADGERVLLIDSDLRRPTQHHLANRPKEPGLSDLLSGKMTLDAVTQKNIAPNLDFIPSGGQPGFTLGMLYANRLKDFIAEARGRYDKVIFDSPPIIGVSDASVLATAVDGSILLIQHRRNPASMVVRAQQILEGLKVPVLGVILNQVPLNSGDDYGYYTNNYTYYTDGGKKNRKAAKSKKGTDGTDDKLILKE